jgi:hypothetical protein
VNPWLLAAVAAAVVAFLFGQRQTAPATTANDGGTVPSRPGEGGSTEATALPPGLPTSGSTGQDAIVSSLSSEPVGSNPGPGSSAPPPGTVYNPSAFTPAFTPPPAQLNPAAAALGAQFTPTTTSYLPRHVA